MRCLTIGETLRRRGHDVVLHASLSSVEWVRDAAAAAQVEVRDAEAGTLQVGDATDFDAVVIDSYDVDADSVGALAERVPVLAIVDGDARGIRATRYLDHNLGAEGLDWPAAVRARLLAGAAFALVRADVIAARRPEPWRISGTPPRLVVVLGGTDPTGATAHVAASLADAGLDAEMTIVSSAVQDAIARLLPASRIIAPTAGLPALLAGSDVVVCAAGSSAWEVCSLGVPAVFVAVALNQRPSLSRLVAGGFGLGADAAGDPGALEGVGAQVQRLISDDELRRALSERCRGTFDGLGAERVADELEAMVAIGHV
jgi:spore coat polysaccharide biosynthesis predicted glycosyltransferase SpsG